MKNKTWFITGGSKGLGLALVERLLANGANVAVTSRTKASLIKQLGEKKNLLALEVEVTSEQSVKDAVKQTIDRFGGIDVVVNNAGYGQLGALEELTDKEAREDFDVNVFGTLNVIRAVTPHLRAKRSGQIYNIGSVGGFYGDFPGWGVYCGTKFAVAGLTEGLAAELAEFNVHATVVYPGYFRTEFLTGGSLRLPKNAIADYKAVRSSETQHVEQINNNQPGDPNKLAEALIKVAEMPQPPVHLFLGSDAVGLADKKIAQMAEIISAHRAISVSTDFAK